MNFQVDLLILKDKVTSLTRVYQHVDLFNLAKLSVFIQDLIQFPPVTLITPDKILTLETNKLGICIPIIDALLGYFPEECHTVTHKDILNTLTILRVDVDTHLLRVLCFFKTLDRTRIHDYTVFSTAVLGFRNDLTQFLKECALNFPLVRKQIFSIFDCSFEALEYKYENDPKRPSIVQCIRNQLNLMTKHVQLRNKDTSTAWDCECRICCIFLCHKTLDEYQSKWSKANRVLLNNLSLYTHANSRKRCTPTLRLMYIQNIKVAKQKQVALYKEMYSYIYFLKHHNDTVVQQCLGSIDFAKLTLPCLTRPYFITENSSVEVTEQWD